jgi:tRNA-splicing endonuclease subunit Sen34
MATEPRSAAATIRISKIAGRYLIFDAEAVSRMRRDFNTCGNLVGTVPQQPTQNIFLGLPIELRPEEVESLVQRNAAHVVDDVAAHEKALSCRDRSAYIASLRKKRKTLEKAFSERTVQKAAEVAEKHGASQAKAKSKANAMERCQSSDDAELFYETRPEESGAPRKVDETNIWGITPASSIELLSPGSDSDFEVSKVPEAPFARFLQSSGYYMTPGLRFGSRYSVYPGDPLRFHAHFMANSYEWDQGIPIMDIVEGGRLATAVKKAFLIGAQEPSKDCTRENPVRSFSIEWAGM